MRIGRPLRQLWAWNGLAVTGAAVKRCHQAVLGEGQDFGLIITPGSRPGTSGKYILTAGPSGSASNSAG